jgi:mono/diheme cytochrome c family protein
MDDVQGGVKKPVPSGAGQETQIWHFPSRAQCLQCHTTAAGISLGPTLAQMNFDLAYPSGVTSNQLETWQHIGLFEAPLPAQRPAAYPAAADGVASAESRARAYLHVNCSNCHRPEGSFEGIDLRLGTPLGGTGLCNVAPEKGDLGVPGALRLVPADPGLSLTSIRMHRLTEGRMPQIGTSVVDAAGVAAVDAWIRQLPACP